MIAKILKSKSGTFAGVTYNINKIDQHKGELMLTANFGPLEAFSNLRPQDYINYLLMISRQNKRVTNPQFHAVISGKGNMYDDQTLTDVAVDYLKEMGYGEQPYLIVCHKDTDNVHVHMVTTRVDRNGKKIDSAFEKIRSVNALNKILGYDFALRYRFSTEAQFYMILEACGFAGRDYIGSKLQKKIETYALDKARAAELKALFIAEKDNPDFIKVLKDNKVELIFHSSEGKKVYGYSVIDHASRQVFKGSEILSLKYLAHDYSESNSFIPAGRAPAEVNTALEKETKNLPESVHLGPVLIADDIDDQQVLGMKRRRQGKARTNTR